MEKQQMETQQTNTIQRNIQRLLTSQYLNYRAVLAIDLIVVVICSLLSYTIITYLTNIPIRAVTMLKISAITMGVSLLSFYLFKTYRHIIRHSTLLDLWRIFFSVLIKEVLTLLLLIVAVPRVYLVNERLYAFILFDLLFCAISLVFIRMAMVQIYNINNNGAHTGNKSRILVYGSSNDSVAIVKRIAQSKKYQVIGFCHFGQDAPSLYLAGFPVYSIHTKSDFNKLITLKEIKGLLFTGYEEAQAEKDRLINYCAQAGIKSFITPPINEMNGPQPLKNELQSIKIEDLLGREEIQIRKEEIAYHLKDKVVMVTGAAGSIGRELCYQLATLGIKQLILFDSAETPMHNLRLEIERKYPNFPFCPIIGDVRIKQRVEKIFERHRPEIVFHAAAYKHVPLMEENPCEAVLVNTTGTKNVADIAVKYGVEKVIMISTDKAIHPANVMGCSKRLAEIYVQSLGKAIEEGTLEGKTHFITTRFGNLLGSSGSVIPLFRSQIEHGGPVTVTHPEMLHYFLTIPEACRLILQSATLSENNETLLFEMGEPVKITDLARRMIELAGYIPDQEIKIQYTGLRPGEELCNGQQIGIENATSTSHEKIFRVEVRDYDYNDIQPIYAELESLSRAVHIQETIELMKQTVPEYI